MNTLHIWTKDDLRLQGVHYESDARDTCVIMIHGMSGNFIENYFADVLGKDLSDAGFGFVFGHNRGYCHVNDILKKDGTFARLGTTYERFLDSVYDIDAWVSEVRRLGYKRIVLLGHSLGCNKTIHYFSDQKPDDVVGVVLASPPDMVGLFEMEKYQPNHKELLVEARENVEAGEPRRLVSGLIWDWYTLSSQTYLDLSENGGPVDNLPVLRNPDVFPELVSINVPILGIMGEKDDIAIRSLDEDLRLLKEKSTGCPSFTESFIKDGSHTYDGQEKAFSQVVIDWVKGL